jgi:ABC-type uncharacterized transport system involved in gliding motility auxiliary subunit
MTIREVMWRAMSAGRVPAECAVLVEPNPRTRYTPSETDVLAEYLRSGGSALLLYDIDFPVEPRLSALLASVGVQVGDGVVVDPLDHYFTDEQMVAVTRYFPHAMTRGLALSFYPGVRPLETKAARGVTTSSLFASSPESYIRSPRVSARSTPRAPRGAHPLAIASEGVLSGDERPFRVVVVGDGDFVSNSFFSYMSNSDVALGMIAWLLREERAPTMRPPVEVLPTVALTQRQTQGIFLVTVVVLPGLVVGAGGIVWWRRRR